MYSGVKLFITGDATVGMQYVPFAKSKIYGLRALGFKFASKALEINNVEIVIKLSPSVDKIFINVPTTSYLSGFLDTYPILVQRYNMYGDPIPYTPFQIGTQTIAEERYLIPPATTITPKMSFFRKVRTPGIKSLLLTELPVEPGAPIPDQVTVTPPAIYPVRFREVFERFLPSKFTGLMRGVMQIAHATNQWTNIAQVKVDYHFGNCYGVVQNPATKAYYLLRITANSVYYIPATFAVSTTGDAPNTQDVIQLISLKNNEAVEIYTILPGMGSSWSEEIGWAFSYTTPEASIVYQSGRFIGNQVYTTAELLTLTFGFAVDTGLPLTAVLTRNGPQIFWANRFMEDPGQGDYGLFNVPRFSPGPLGLYGESLNFGPGRPYPHVRPIPYPGYAVNNMPIYVYYTRMGRKICNYTFQSAATPDANLAHLGQYYFDIEGESSSTHNRDDVRTSTWYTRIDATNFDLSGNYTLLSPLLTLPHAIGFGNTQQQSQNEAISHTNTIGAAASIITNPGGFPCPFSDIQWINPASANGTARYSDTEHGGVFGLITLTAAGVTTTETLITTNDQQIMFDTSLTLSLTDREASVIYARTILTAFNQVSETWDGPTTKDEANSVVNTTTTHKTEKMFLYGGHAPIELDAKKFGNNNLMLDMHPYPQQLDYKSTTAAFNPANVAYQTAPGSIGNPLVKFIGGEYDVENSLYGWIGIV